MITRLTKVTGKATIWAVPTTEWERQDNPDIGMFKYTVAEHTYRTGAVKVRECEVTLTVPAGINLLERAIATLEEERTRVLGEAQKKAMELEQEIKKLLLLGGPEQATEGELILANEDKTPEMPADHFFTDIGL